MSQQNQNPIYPSHQPQRKPDNHSTRKALLIVGPVVAVVAVAAVVGGNTGTSQSTGDTSAAAVPTVTATSSATTQPTVPAEAPTNAPATKKPSAPAQPSKPKPAAPAQPSESKPAAAPAKPRPVSYAKLSARMWKKVAKDPDAYIGKTYVVYGVVTQFDAATGADGFRADVDGIKQRPSYGFVDYPTNTVLVGDAARFDDLVEDDLFTAKVIVEGSYSYETQIGGETTVPKLRVASIKVTGSVD